MIICPVCGSRNFRVCPSRLYHCQDCGWSGFEDEVTRKEAEMSKLDIDKIKAMLTEKKRLPEIAKELGVPLQELIAFIGKHIWPTKGE